ncbi:MAG: isoleucine--tRNA ligase [Candidatus Omnitrophica bacterium]|nr:isoleucine--tRNA ligase [Candidatus Omnitrophota bacterium]
MNYRDTLNLPKTDFSMRASLAKKEPDLLKKWEEQGLYQAIRKNAKGKKEFILHDGPPYANGNIHIGHALNKILKDIIVKFKTMQGFDSLYVPGWDCHGLPIEHQLLKEMKAHKSQVELVDFRKKAHDYAMKYVEIQKEQFKRLGIFGEWDDPYLTLDPEYEYWILKSLAQLNKKGYLYRGLKPVNWCAVCETALAEAEVEYENHSSPSVFVKFKVENPQQCKEADQKKKISLLVWTTTPWTLLANVAVAVHPSYRYVFVDVGDEILVLEKTLSVSVLEKGGVQDFKIIKECSGKDLENFFYTHPFELREHCPVVSVDYVTREDGTGLVHTAPGHGQEDYETGLKFKLDVVVPVDHRGVFTDEGAEFKGMHVFKANPIIIERLTEKGILFFSQDVTHSYPHCWRCKKPIIFRATKQWFVSIDHDHLRSKLVKAIKEEVQWIPESGEDRILGMVKTRPDWCLSRQRYWGVPIPALICHGCGDEQKLFSDVVEHLADLVKKEGTDVWFEKDIKDLLPIGFVCPDCGKADFEKANDILDVWFDSGVSHQAVLKGKIDKTIPADLYLEGSDQHRGWFQSSLIPAVAMEGCPPFKAVLTHGFVVDGNGRKMSKSLGNVMSPLDIIKNYGADFLRLWVASSNYNEDIRISKEIMDRLVDAYRKIRNTARFMLSNLFDFDIEKDIVSCEEMLALDQWALDKMATMAEEVEKSFDQYNFSDVYKKIYSFCNEEMSGKYLDILKDRLYTSASKSIHRRSAQTALFYILDVLVRLTAPILSFTSQEIFEAMPKESAVQENSNIHLLSWPDQLNQWQNKKVSDSFKIIEEVRPSVLASLEEKRQQGIIGSSQEARIIFNIADNAMLQRWQACDKMFDLKTIFIVSAVEINKAAQGFNITVERADGMKCLRCWNYSSKIGQDKEHPELCEHCLPVIQNM